jgi:hypothetical protein
VEPFPIAAVVLLVLAVTVGLRVVAGMLDGDRIRDYLRERNCALRSRQWQPFGQGWFGESTSRIYSVEYEDGHGYSRQATVKTSMWTGVFFTNDTLIAASADASAAAPADAPAAATASEPSEIERLRAENERLRAALEQRN